MPGSSATSSAFTAMLETARNLNCPRNQIENFTRAGYVPQPRQLAFHALCRSCDEVGGPLEVAFGGARGPGKTHALLAQMGLDDCQRIAGLKCLLLRRVGKAVRESFEDLRVKLFAVTPHTYNRSSGSLSFPNGSRIILGHFKDERDVDNYLGLEYGLIGVEEATTLQLSKYKAIRTCNRTSRDDWRPRTYSNANPGGVGHRWYKRRFVSETGHPRFIPATYRDNKFLNPEYVETLNDLTGWLLRAWRDGDWDIAAGQYFSTFAAGVHVIEPQPVSKWWDVWMAMDTGWTHPTAALLFAKDPSGNVHVVDEYQVRRRLPLAHCSQFQQMLDRWDIRRERVQVIATGQDAWSKDREGRCVADSYEEAGWPLDKADMARVQGAWELLRRLGDPGAGIAPTLFIYDTCVDLIELLPALQHDPHRPEDVLKTDADDEGMGGDDLYDTLRYGIMHAAEAKALEYGTLLVPR